MDINNNYIPYGEEWVKEMMKIPKHLLISKLKIEYEKNAALQPSPLPLIDKGSEAIEFAEWINKEGYVEYDWYDRWIAPHNNNNVYDTKKLYELFKNKKQ